MTLIATLGGSTSNSYISVAEADLILNAGFKATAWAALSDSEKEISLQQSTRQLEYLLYQGVRCDPSTDDCLLYTSPSPRDRTRSRMPSSA